MAKSVFWLGTLLLLTSCNYEPRDTGRPQEVTKDESGRALTFGGVDEVDGSRFFTLPIYLVEDRGGGSGGPYFSKGTGSEWNRLIVDSASGANRRVLPNENAEIVNWIEPSPSASSSADELLVDMDARSAASGTKSSSGLYAAVVKRPGKAAKDPATYDVLLGHFEDGRQQWIAQGLDGLESAWVTPAGKLAIVAASRGRAIYRLYDPSTFRQLLETELKIKN